MPELAQAKKAADDKGNFLSGSTAFAGQKPALNGICRKQYKC